MRLRHFVFDLHLTEWSVITSAGIDSIPCSRISAGLRGQMSMMNTFFPPTWENGYLERLKQVL